MRYTAKVIIRIGSLALMLGAFGVAPQAYAGGEMPSKAVCKDAKDPVVAGGCVATDRKKGNCMACHQFKGLEKTRLQAGNVAPPLVAMKQRYPDKAKLKKQVQDATVANPNSSMPPFGRHKILNDKEVDLVVEWLYSL